MMHMDEPQETISFWQGLAEGGPVILLLLLCMVVCFSVSVVLAFRGERPLLTFSFAFAPFALGAYAMWLGVRDYISVFPSFFNGLYSGNAVEALHLLQRPFFIGTLLSTVALIVYFFARALLPKIATRDSSRGSGIGGSFWS